VVPAARHRLRAASEHCTRICELTIMDLMELLLHHFIPLFQGSLCVCSSCGLCRSTLTLPSSSTLFLALVAAIAAF